MDASHYCTRCKRPVQNPETHKITDHAGLKDYSFIITMEEFRQQLTTGPDGKPLVGKYLYFYGDDPARDRDYHGIVINALPARKSDKWLPRLRDLYRFQNRNYIETLEFLANNLFKKMPPAIYTVDASNNPAYAELLERKLGKRLHPLKFGNSGTTNTKYDLKVIMKQYIKLGYEFPDPDYLLRQRMVTPEKADLLRILKDEALREMAVLTESDRISFEHPLGKHNDMIHAEEMSLKGVMEYQKGNFGISFQAISMMHGASHETAATETPIQRAEAGLMGRLNSLGLNIKNFKIEMPDSSQN